MNNKSLVRPKPLTAEIAAQKGVESFYEFVFYGLAIGIPVYEYSKQVVAEQKKEQALEERIGGLEGRLRELGEWVEGGESRAQLAME